MRNRVAGIVVQANARVVDSGKQASGICGCIEQVVRTIAGIFQSNLGNETQARSHGNASRDAFEAALGCPVYDEFSLYEEAETRSKQRCGLL